MSPDTIHPNRGLDRNVPSPSGSERNRHRQTSRLARPILGLLLGSLAIFGGLARGQGQSAGRTATKPDELTLEGPYTHQNLAVYVVRGRGSDTREYITLDEGLTTKTVAVRERGARAGQDQAEVNRLEIENRSDRWLFLQAGDVVKGGKQDRTIGIDVALAPRSKPQPIDAFCVEHGRWVTKKDGLAFGGNPTIVGSNALKMSIQGDKNQSRVWEEVAKQEARAAAVAAPPPMGGQAAGESVPSSLSATDTYNAIVENKKIRSGREAYLTALLPHLEKASDGLGLVVAINGEITAADVYDSAPLFHKLSRKLLDSYALEAVLARDPKTSVARPPAKTAVLAFLSDPSKVEGQEEKVAESMHRRTRDTGRAVAYEYTVFDGQHSHPTKPLHRNYLKK